MFILAIRKVEPNYYGREQLKALSYQTEKKKQLVTPPKTLT